MSTVVEITFSRKVNTGNYEKFDVSLVAALGPDEGVLEAMRDLQGLVDTICDVRLRAVAPWLRPRPSAERRVDDDEPTDGSVDEP